MKKLILIHFTSLLVLNLNFGCATKPPDFHACTEVSLDRGECLTVMSGQKIRVDETHKLGGKTWWEMRPINIIIPLSDYTEIKKWIIKLCKKNKNMCDKEVSTWERNLETIDKQVGEKR